MSRANSLSWRIISPLLKEKHTNNELLLQVWEKQGCEVKSNDKEVVVRIPNAVFPVLYGAETITRIKRYIRRGANVERIPGTEEGRRGNVGVDAKRSKARLAKKGKKETRREMERRAKRSFLKR